MTNEEIRDRIAKHFGLGDYGVRLADEYLAEYVENILRDHWVIAPSTPAADLTVDDSGQ